MKLTKFTVAKGLSPQKPYSRLDRVGYFLVSSAVAFSVWVSVTPAL